jgi:hypothetical protein
MGNMGTMKSHEQILKAYKKADRIRRDNMWCRFISLRGEFDNIERYGKTWETDATPLLKKSTGILDSLAESPSSGKKESLVNNDPVKRYGQRVEFTDKELDRFYEGGHRIRHVKSLAEAAPHYSIGAEIVEARHCNAGHKRGQMFVLDVDGNFITKLCPKRMCVYLVSQLTTPVALINERLSEGHAPNDFHFMRYVRCPDTGVDCLGYGEVMMKVGVVPRMK